MNRTRNNWKRKKIECNYYSCHRTDNLSRCRYCNKLFCPDHIEPRLVQVPNFKIRNAYDYELYNDYRKEGGHPCMAYTNYKYEQRKKEDEAFDKFLNKLKSTPYQEEKIIVQAKKKDPISSILSPFIFLYKVITASLKQL